MSLRVAVIGVGHLGRHHARILSALPGARLVAVVDTNRARAEEIARTVNAQALFDARDLAGQVDAVTIAVPTEVHRDIAMPFLEAGIPAIVLIDFACPEWHTHQDTLGVIDPSSLEGVGRVLQSLVTDPSYLSD